MRNKMVDARHHRLIYLLSVAQRRLQRWMAARAENEVTPAQAKAGAAEVNAALTDGFTAAEIDIVARWLTSIQDKFPRPSETRHSDQGADQ